MCREISCVYTFSATTFSFFFFNDTATTEIYTLSLHDALPISGEIELSVAVGIRTGELEERPRRRMQHVRSEEHTSELQSQSNLVCRLLLEKKKTIYRHTPRPPHPICRAPWPNSSSTCIMLNAY